MLPANVETDIVTGDLYEPRDPDHLLRELDQYEGCMPEHPMPYIFGRELVRVRCNDTEHNAWAYFFRQSVDESQRIASGEYKQRP